jgi:hypothetical protein
LDANEVKEEPSENIMKRVMSAEASILESSYASFQTKNKFTSIIKTVLETEA